MIISTEMAQKIVDHLMGIVNRNVNIMDCNGMIIASGQADRINTFHKGGKLAVDENRVVEIYPDEIDSYAGALPGVMWPIDLTERVVGVVGVTGNPQDVRPMANLIKTVTELILEREMFLADYGSENRIKEQLVTLLFADNRDIAADDINNLAEMVNYTFNTPRMVIVIKLEPKINDSAFVTLQNLLSDRIRECVLKAVKEATFFTAKDMVLFYKKDLCILKSAPDGFDARKFNAFMSGVIDILKSVQPPLKIKVGIGGWALKDLQLQQSYREALFALGYASSNTVCSIYEFDILLNYLFDNKCTSYDSCLALQELGHKFDEVRDRYDMHKVLECLLTNNLNISLTASRLFIHRNTLKFRLEKLKKIVGLEPCHSFHHAMLCKFLLCCDERATKLRLLMAKEFNKKQG
ncbi:CdaR family transcriptional regulator [Sporomusa sp.]|uniref:CdaR family transcriptional regulator n=1 Tax=Sporomusa sp. TaxID=2078658 RepID=UPI002C04A9A9|nr:sugar diacid recognition domain-containing protein [Sporomusa sp.]HWR05959.1 sugar diacid recognition domain-containing protein [Sporomusa sp.]